MVGINSGLICTQPANHNLKKNKKPTNSPKQENQFSRQASSFGCLSPAYLTGWVLGKIGSSLDCLVLLQALNRGEENQIHWFYIYFYILFGNPLVKQPAVPRFQSTVRLLPARSLGTGLGPGRASGRVGGARRRDGEARPQRDGERGAQAVGEGLRVASEERDPWPGAPGVASEARINGRGENRPRRAELRTSLAWK